MGGEDQRSGAKPTGGRSFEDNAVRRPRRAKPPPGIITAGGVDMARGHASGIVVREGPAPEIPSDEPRVVLALETNPRKVPTHRRLLEGRDPAASGEDGARGALLPAERMPTHTTQPSARVPTPAHAAPGPDATAPPRSIEGGAAAAADEKLPIWLRIAIAAILLALLAGTVLRLSAQPASQAAARAPYASHVALPLAPSPPASVAPPTPPATATSAAPPPPPPTAQPSPSSDPPRRGARAPAGAAKPRAFIPPFQLPSERN